MNAAFIWEARVFSHYHALLRSPFEMCTIGLFCFAGMNDKQRERKRAEYHALGRYKRHVRIAIVMPRQKRARYTIIGGVYLYKKTCQYLGAQHKRALCCIKSVAFFFSFRRSKDEALEWDGFANRLRREVRGEFLASNLSGQRSRQMNARHRSALLAPCSKFSRAVYTFSGETWQRAFANRTN